MMNLILALLFGEVSTYPSDLRKRSRWRHRRHHYKIECTGRMRRAAHFAAATIDAQDARVNHELVKQFARALISVLGRRAVRCIQVSLVA